MKKIIFIAYCFLCCAVFAQEKKENIVAKVQVSALKKRNVYETLIYGARLEPAALIPVYSPGNGIVNKLTAQEGMMVTKDSLLAEVKRKNLSSDFLPWQVKSPIDGIVAYVDTVQNSEVFDKTKLLTIGDVSSYKVNLLLSDKDIQKIKLNDKIYVKGTNVFGNVKSISLVPEGSSGLFKVEVRYQKYPNFFIGKFLELEIRINPFTGVVVPIEWVVSKYGKNYLYIYNDGVVDMREVKTGGRYGKDYAIVSGVKVGEQVIIGYDRLLYSGLKAQITEK
ncbi:MAG: HlyD family efflux transporter periplasmic adaptor subunit [Spirochaetales bacterium]|nr:HlyD family efflux transporter periplasmic adaptor subunit [Spirochaetales bacterium]MBR2317824.1 HlyD family efflux transporter periplasmic adaptor subunit [Spirochaetales bacterium]